jgi:hypothetical protein
MNQSPPNLTGSKTNKNIKGCNNSSAMQPEAHHRSLVSQRGLIHGS